MPALQATRIEPMRTLRGEVIKDARPRRSRNILIGLQVGASALLLICSAVFLRSALASAMVDPGIRTADTVSVDVINEPKRQLMVQAVTTDPSVISVAANRPDVLSAPRVAIAQASSAKANVSYKFVSPQYFDVLDIPIVRGRGFTDEERSESLPVAIVSQGRDRARQRPGRLESQPGRHRRRVPGRRLDSRASRVAPRPDADAATGLAEDPPFFLHSAPFACIVPSSIAFDPVVSCDSPIVDCRAVTRSVASHHLGICLASHIGNR